MSQALRPPQDCMRHHQARLLHPVGSQTCTRAKQLSLAHRICAAVLQCPRYSRHSRPLQPCQYSQGRKLLLVGSSDAEGHGCCGAVYSVGNSLPSSTCNATCVRENPPGGLARAGVDLKHSSQACACYCDAVLVWVYHKWQARHTHGGKPVCSVSCIYHSLLLVVHTHSRLLCHACVGANAGNRPTWRLCCFQDGRPPVCMLVLGTLRSSSSGTQCIGSSSTSHNSTHNI